MASRDPTLIQTAQVLANPQQFDAIIDVRSPAEFALDHMPGAINLPVLSDDERAQVGTVHKQGSAFDGSRIGAALVARNIARLIDTELADKHRTWKPLIYCWRGGQRSQSLALILSRIGWRTHLLEGGYRDYRRAIVDELACSQADVPFVVIAGRTGTAKSLVLAQLAAQGQQVLDLEGLARHKGSVLGDLPNDPQPSQKMFESSVAAALRGFDRSKPVYVESESKKVGRCHVPDQVMLQMRASKVVTIEASVAWRADYLLQVYQHFVESTLALFKQLDCLVPLHGYDKIEAWKRLAQNAEWTSFVSALLNEHYDPAYDKAISRNFKEPLFSSSGQSTISMNLDNPEAAALVAAKKIMSLVT